MSAHGSYGPAAVNNRRPPEAYTPHAAAICKHCQLIGRPLRRLCRWWSMTVPHGQPLRRPTEAADDRAEQPGSPLALPMATDDCSVPAAGTSSTAEGGGGSAALTATPPHQRVARQQHKPMREFTPRACLQCDWTVIYDCNSALNKHMRKEHGTFYSAKRGCDMVLRGGEPLVRQQHGGSFRGHSPHSVSIGSNAERRKLPKMDTGEVEHSQPQRRNRRRRKPAPSKPGDRGTQSVTVASGPGDATRQGAGGQQAAGVSAPAAQHCPPSPASSTAGEFGPRPQIDLRLEGQEALSPLKVTVSWADEGGTEAVRAPDDVVVPDCYNLRMVDQGTAMEPPRVTVGSTQTPSDEPGPATAPPCSTADQSPPTATVTADAASQCQGPETTPPCLPTRPPMSTVDLVAMARPFWFMPIGEAAPRAVSTVLQTYSTSLEHRELETNLQWAHVGRRDLGQFLLHRMADESREGRSAEQILQSLWWFLSNMQH